jgi:hypothetical protein
VSHSEVLGDRRARDEFERAYDAFLVWLQANASRCVADAGACVQCEQLLACDAFAGHTARLKCRFFNVYDMFLEWILFDAFDDLETIPQALQVTAIVCARACLLSGCDTHARTQLLLRWTPAGAKRSVIVNFVSRHLDSKIAAARAYVTGVVWAHWCVRAYVMCAVQ